MMQQYPTWRPHQPMPVKLSAAWKGARESTTKNFSQSRYASLEPGRFGVTWTEPACRAALPYRLPFLVATSR